MAQGDVTLFEEYAKTIGDKLHDMGNDSFSARLVNAIPSAALATPVWADISATEVSGGGYSAGGVALTTTWAEAAGVGTFDATGAPAASWTKNATGPTDIKALVIVNDTSVNKDLVGYVDMTSDGGTTPISLQDGDITWTPHADGIFTLTIS